MDVVRDVWRDTSRADLNLVCFGKPGTFLCAIGEDKKPMADRSVVMGPLATRSNRAGRESEVELRFDYALSTMPEELVPYAEILMAAGYRVV